MARGEMEGIVWLDDFAFVPKNIGLSVRYIGKNNYDLKYSFNEIRNQLFSC